jgi:hypothetical protein
MFIRKINGVAQQAPPQPLTLSPKFEAVAEFPKGAEVTVKPALVDVIFWPLVIWVEDGGTATFHTARLRNIPVLLPPGAEKGLRVLARVDRTEIPRGDPTWIDALDMRACLENERLDNEDGRPTLRGLLPLPYHVFAISGANSVYVRLDASATELDLRREWGKRRVESELRLNGEPLPTGTLVAPGRLDLLTAAWLEEWHPRGRTFGCHVSGAGVSAPLELPRSEWVTLWHPEVGLAWVRPGDDGLVEGRTGACSISFHAPARGTIRGTASVWPAWPGGAGSFTTPSEWCIAHQFAGVAEARVVGLPPGRYRAVYAFEPADGKGAVHRSRAEVDVSEKHPVAEVVIDESR